MRSSVVLLLFCFFFIQAQGSQVFVAEVRTPAVITTWKFINATRKAWNVLFANQRPALDAIEEGCAVCEDQQCDFTVGYGGSPDEKGETTLDAMIMDGTTMNVGAVGGLRNIKNAIGVARRVLVNSQHSFLIGSLATEFGIEMGFQFENLTTHYSLELHEKWRKNNCQPNFRTNVTPDPTHHCGPYKPNRESPHTDRWMFRFGEDNHDTIGMVAVDRNGHLASGTSTNGAKYKIPGRVGDSPIAGAGSYADDEVGGAAATGDGDIMMRFLPSFLAVEEMKRGKSPEKAAQIAVDRISAKYEEFRGGVIVLRKDGVFGAACSGMKAFPYCVASPVTGDVKVYYKVCSNNRRR